MKHAVIMTFPTSKFDVYGYCIKGFIKNWPSTVHAYAIVEEPENLPIEYLPSNLTILDFEKTCGEKVKAFENSNQHRDIFDMTIGKAGNISTQAAKFSRKAYAQLYGLQNIEAENIWYIDADLLTLKPINEKFLDRLATGDHYIGCTPRWWKKGDGSYTETGLILWKKHMSIEHQLWCKLYAECYDDNKIFEFDAWHDCIAFDYATKKLIEQNIISIFDFGFGIKSSHPLVSGQLGKYFDHMKGERKFIGKSSERISTKNRYIKILKNKKYYLSLLQKLTRIFKRK